MQLSEATTRVGAQRPTFELEPERSYTDGDNAAELSAVYAFELDPWQRHVVDCWLGRDDNGRLTAVTCGLPCPRQNGKNGIIEAFEFFMLLNVPQTHILHTAHQVKTAKKAFNRLAGMFEDKKHPELQAELKLVRRTNGEEMIVLQNGNTIEYASRSRGGGRGFDAITVVIYDEAQELTEEQVEALMSTLAASPTGDRQVIYAGTPPGPNTPGDVFKHVRKSAMSADAPAGMAWHEWSVLGDACPVTSEMVFADVLDMVYRTNPAMGKRLSEDFTEQEFATMSPEGFARERLGWWDSDQRQFKAAISQDNWKKTAVGLGDVPQSGIQSFGVKFAPEGDRAALAVCRVMGNGEQFIELVNDLAMPARLDILADWLSDTKRLKTVAAIGIDGKAYSGALDAELLRRGVKKRQIRMMTTDNVCSAACFGAVSF